MPSIEHPANSEDTLFLLFDPVHLFKNFYTNLLRKESFKCPKVDKKSVDVCLSHVISLYHRELGKSVKIAQAVTQEMKKSNCDSCVSLLAKEKEAPVICFDLEEPKISGQEVDSASNEANSLAEDEKKKFLDKINRGGLCTPSDLVYITCLHA